MFFGFGFRDLYRKNFRKTPLYQRPWYLVVWVFLLEKLRKFHFEKTLSYFLVGKFMQNFPTSMAFSSKNVSKNCNFTQVLSTFSSETSSSLPSRLHNYSKWNCSCFFCGQSVLFRYLEFSGECLLFSTDFFLGLFSELSHVFVPHCVQTNSRTERQAYFLVFKSRFHQERFPTDKRGRLCFFFAKQCENF